MRGEPDVLLGERGGAVPAGNMEGKELLAAFGLEQFPGTFKGAPDFVSFSKDVTCTYHQVRHENKIANAFTVFY